MSVLCLGAGTVIREQFRKGNMHPFRSRDVAGRTDVEWILSTELCRSGAIRFEDSTIYAWVFVPTDCLKMLDQTEGVDQISPSFAFFEPEDGRVGTILCFTAVEAPDHAYLDAEYAIFPYPQEEPQLVHADWCMLGPIDPLFTSEFSSIGSPVHQPTKLHASDQQRLPVR